MATAATGPRLRREAERARSRHSIAAVTVAADAATAGSVRRTAAVIACAGVGCSRSSWRYRCTRSNA